MMPKVEFQIINSEDEIKDITEILYNKKDEDIEEIFFAYPILFKRLQKSSNDEESNKIIAKFFRAKAKDTKGKAIKYKQVFQRIWNIINNDFFSIISKIMEIKIDDNQIFYGNVTFSPIKKINIKSNSFKIYLKTPTRETKDATFHEVSELLFYKKFEEIFSKEKDNKLKNNFIKIILRSVLTDSKIQKISIYKPKINKKYNDIVIDNNFLLNIVDKMYKEKINFNKFSKDIWELLKKNKIKINKQV